MPRRPRVLLMPSPVASGSIGSVTKMIGTAHALVLRGADVRFVVGGRLAELVAQHGFAVERCPTPQYSGDISPIRNVVDFITWTGMAAESYVQHAVESDIAAVTSFKPDVVFAEARPSAPIAAEATGTPLVTVAGWPTHPEFPDNRAATDQPLDVFNDQLRRYGLREIRHVAELIFMRSDVKISPSLPDLEPELRDVQDVHFVGYMLDVTKKNEHMPAWFDDWYQTPFLLVYLSVSAISPQRYTATLTEAFRDSPYRVLCACGFHYEVDYGALRSHNDNVRFVEYVPIQNVINRAQLMIFHGGQDTMLMALLHGVPSITIPGQHSERRYNAAQLERLGASRTLPVHAFRLGRLRRVVEEVLQGPYGARSQKLSDGARAYRGTDEAAELILGAAANPSTR